MMMPAQPLPNLRHHHADTTNRNRTATKTETHGTGRYNTSSSPSFPTMARPKAPGKDGTKKRKELERQEEEEQQLAANAAGAGAAPPADDDDDGQPQQALTFMQHDFGLDRRLIKAVAKMGFVYPTLVQNKCIPLALKGKDLLVSYYSYVRGLPYIYDARQHTP